MIEAKITIDCSKFDGKRSIVDVKGGNSGK